MTATHHPEDRAALHTPADGQSLLPSDETRSPLLHVHLGCAFDYDTTAGIEFVILVQPPPHGERAHALWSQQTILPTLPVRTYRDSLGNDCWRVTAAGPTLTFRYDALFAVPEAPDVVNYAAQQLPLPEVPDAVLVYTLPSRFCQSDLLVDDAWRLFGTAPLGYARVQAICDWVHSNITYGTALTGPSVSAVDTFQVRQGVCRDLAHLPIAFCRALNIPARYVFGYLPDADVVAPDPPMDFHAWFEAYLGGRWYTFDARHNTPRGGRVKVAHGRDAVDVAMVTSYGLATLQRMTVWADAPPVAWPDPPASCDAARWTAAASEPRQEDPARSSVSHLAT